MRTYRTENHYHMHTMHDAFQAHQNDVSKSLFTLE